MEEHTYVGSYIQLQFSKEGCAMERMSSYLQGRSTHSSRSGHSQPGFQQTTVSLYFQYATFLANKQWLRKYIEYWQRPASIYLVRSKAQGFAFSGWQRKEDILHWRNS